MQYELTKLSAFIEIKGIAMNANSPSLAKRVKFSDRKIITNILDIANGLEDVISLGRGDPDLNTPNHIIKAGQKALANGATHYTHPLGILPLREAIVDNIRSHGGAQYSADEIMIVPGAQQGMFIIALSLLNPGDEIIIPCPSYNPYFQAAELSSAVPVEIPMTMATNFTLTADMVAKHISPKSKILVLINPNNPTGTVTPPDEIKKIAELAIQNDLIIISDEIYARLTFCSNVVLPVAALSAMKDRTITLSGFSKAYAMTGWRIGYLAGPRNLIKPMNEVNHALNISTATVSQYAALAAMIGPQDCVEEMRQTYDDRRKSILRGLEQIGMKYAEPQGGFYVYASVASLSLGIGASNFCERLLIDGQVMIHPGTIYGDHTDDFVRISMTQPVDRIEIAMKRMAEVIKKLNADAKTCAERDR
ncbi:MAG: pyridoxal phosphate-dependent aminotransferase [Paracoccaceae bacterium]|nr:pyridoxal phosphate-dependent aminotransferase [Paracoccaceae bacterium]